MKKKDVISAIKRNGYSFVRKNGRIIVGFREAAQYLHMPIAEFTFDKHNEIDSYVFYGGSRTELSDYLYADLVRANNNQKLLH